MGLTPAEQELNSYLNLLGDGASVGDVVKHFEKAPFGWKDISTLDVFVQLAKKGLRQFEHRSEEIKVKEFAEQALNSRERDAITVSKAKVYSQEETANFISMVNNDIFADVLIPSSITDFIKAVDTFKEKLKPKLDTLSKEIDMYYQSQFATHIKTFHKYIEELCLIRNPEEVVKRTGDQKNYLKTARDKYMQAAEFANRNFEDYQRMITFVEDNRSNFTDLGEDYTIRTEDFIDYINNDNEPWERFPQMRKLYNELNKAIRERVKALREEVVERYEKIFEEIDKRKAELKDGANITTNKDYLLQQINRDTSLDKLKLQKSLENSINSEEKRLNKGIDIWNDTIRQTDELKNNKIKHEEELQRARESMPDLTMLSTIRQWFTRKQGFDQHLAETTKEVEKYTRSAKENRERRNQLLSHPLFANLTIGTGSMEVEQYLTETTRHIKEQQHVLNEQEKHVLVREKLKAYADELEEGKPCPLCGAMHHPERFQSDDTGNELTGIRERGIDLEKQIARVSKLEKQLHLLENSHLDALRQIKEWEAKLLERQEQNREHERQFAWPEYKEEKVLDEAFRHAEQLQATIKQKEIELNKITSSWEKEEKNKERYREELDKIRKTLTQQLAELDILRGQLQLVKAGEYLDITPDAIKKEQKRLLAEYRHLEQTFSDTGKQLQEQQQQSERCKSIVTINQQELQQEQSALIDLQQQLDERLADSPFETFEEVAGILSTPFVLEQEKRRVAQFKEQITRNKTTIERLEEEIGSSMYDMEEHQQLVAEIDQVSKQVTENNREQGNLEGIIKKLASDLESQSRLHQELEKLAGRAENHHEVALQSQRFRGIHLFGLPAKSLQRRERPFLPPHTATTQPRDYRRQ